MLGNREIDNHLTASRKKEPSPELLANFTAWVERCNNDGARHGTSIADSRPVASNDPVEGSSDPILLVNFRAGNTLKCLEIVQFFEIASER